MSFPVKRPQKCPRNLQIRVKRVRFADQQESDGNETSEIGERIARKLKKRLVERKLRQEVSN